MDWCIPDVLPSWDNVWLVSANLGVCGPVPAKSAEDSSIIGLIVAAVQPFKSQMQMF